MRVNLTESEADVLVAILGQSNFRLSDSKARAAMRDLLNIIDKVLAARGGGADNSNGKRQEQEAENARARVQV